jgi:hypothetical protein
VKSKPRFLGRWESRKGQTLNPIEATINYLQGDTHTVFTTRFASKPRLALGCEDV